MTNDDLQKLEEAVGKLPARYIFAQAPDPNPRSHALAERARLFAVGGQGVDVKIEEDFVMHLGGNSPNEVVLQAPIDLEKNANIRELLEVTGERFDDDPHILACFISNRSLNVDESRHLGTATLSLDEGIVVSVARDSGEVHGYEIDRGGVRVLPAVDGMAKETVTIGKRAIGRLPSPNARRFDPPDSVLCRSGNTTLHLPAKTRLPIAEPYVGPTTGMFRQVEYARLGTPRRDLDSYVTHTGPQVSKKMLASTSTATLSVKKQALTYVGASSNAIETVEYQSLPGTMSDTWGNPGDMPIGFNDCARAAARQDCRNCVSNRKTAAMAIITGGTVTCLANAAAVGAVVAAIPIWPFTAIAGAGVAAVGAATCAATGGVLLGILFHEADKAARECLNEIITDQGTGQSFKQTYRLVSAVERNDQGALSKLVGSYANNDLWTIDVTDAIDMIADGLPFYTVDSQGRYVRIGRRRRLGHSYVATEPDDTISDNLNQLPTIRDE